MRGRAATAAAQLSAPDIASVYEDEVSFVWNYLRRMGIAEADREDLVHDVFLVVHRQLASYDPSRPLRPWLAGIAFRVASKYRRRARHRREVPQPASPALEAVDAGPNAERLLQRKRARALVHAALDELDDRRRAVFVLHDLEGCSMPEIAEILDVGVNTLYSRLRAARKAFAAAVERSRQGRGGR